MHNPLFKTAAISPLLWLITMLPAHAHSVSVWAEVGEDGQVYVEAYASNGRPVRNGQLTILDNQGNAIITGKTNQEGQFVFTPTSRLPITIQLGVDQGHRSEFLLNGNE